LVVVETVAAGPHPIAARCSVPDTRDSFPRASHLLAFAPSGFRWNVYLVPIVSPLYQMA